MRVVTRRDVLKYGLVAGGALGLGSGLTVDRALGLSTASCKWGAYVNPLSKTQPQAILAFENLIGRKIDVTRHYTHWGRDLPGSGAKWSASGGRLPLIDMSSQRPGGTYAHWGDIANGVFDADIKKMASQMKNWGKPCYFVFNHEPEDELIAGTPAQFKNAFNHMRNVFDNVGAHNLRWLVTLMRGTYEGSHGGADAWVPAGADLLGVDGYNRGGCSPPWVSFAELFTPARNYARNHGMGLVVEEWGSVEQGACGGAKGSTSKATWIHNASATIRNWPEVKAVVYSHTLGAFEGHQLPFWVNTSTSALDAYRQEGHLAYFN